MAVTRVDMAVDMAVVTIKYGSAQHFLLRAPVLGYWLPTIQGRALDADSRVEGTDKRQSGSGSQLAPHLRYRSHSSEIAMSW
jgi:hypothetical protein